MGREDLAAPAYEIKFIIKQLYFNAYDKFMSIQQNRPLDKFMQFIFMRSSALSMIVMSWRDTDLCNLRVARIIHISLTQNLSLYNIFWAFWPDTRKFAVTKIPTIYTE